jgi:predicted nucleic acid-binding protein
MARSVIFFDTSALVKRYVMEPGSTFVTQLLTSHLEPPVVFVSVLTYVEMTAAFNRRQPAIPAAIGQAFAADYRQGMQKIAIGESIIERAVALCHLHRLRAADAIQLASALWVARRLPGILLLAADAEMLLAARAEGLQADDPNRHP